MEFGTKNPKFNNFVLISNKKCIFCTIFLRNQPILYNLFWLSLQVLSTIYNYVLKSRKYISIYSKLLKNLNYFKSPQLIDTNDSDFLEI